MKEFIRRWWPVDMSVPADIVMDVTDTKLKLGVKPQLVDYQPYILRWAFVWVVLSMLYSLERWLSDETVRLVFVTVVILLWLTSGAAFVVLLMFQQQRRGEVKNKIAAGHKEGNQSTDA